MSPLALPFFVSLPEPTQSVGSKQKVVGVSAAPPLPLGRADLNIWAETP